MFCIQIFSFCTGLSVNNYYHVRFPVCLWFTYGSLRWTGAVWRSETVYLDELVWTHTVITFIYRHFAVKEHFQVKEQPDFWYGLEANQFLSYNQPIRMFSRKMQSEQLFIPPAISNLKKPFEFVNFIHIYTWITWFLQYLRCWLKIWLFLNHTLKKSIFL